MGVLGVWGGLRRFSAFWVEKARSGILVKLGAAVGGGAAVGWGRRWGYMAVGEARNLCDRRSGNPDLTRRSGASSKRTRRRRANAEWRMRRRSRRSGNPDLTRRSFASSRGAAEGRETSSPEPHAQKEKLRTFGRGAFRYKETGMPSCFGRYRPIVPSWRDALRLGPKALLRTPLHL